MSLNKSDLERKARMGDKQAKKVFSVRKNGNLLLCTLLVGNVAVNTSLSIFLGSIIPSFIAGLIATLLIVLLGEIVPQAVFSRHGLRFGYRFVWLARFFIIILSPVCWPIAWVLNKALGKELPVIYSKDELIKIIEEHEDSGDSEIDRDEEKILKGALSFSDKTIMEIMTPRIAIFAMPADSKLDKATVKKIFKAGNSRIPIYQDSLDDIVGVLYVKDLIVNFGKTKKLVKDMAREDVVFVKQDKHLDDLFKAFKKIHKHLFVVLDNYDLVVGIVTIEDVLEEIINDEIVDEYDKYKDMQKIAQNKFRHKKRKKI